MFEILTFCCCAYLIIFPPIAKHTLVTHLNGRRIPLVLFYSFWQPGEKMYFLCSKISILYPPTQSIGLSTSYEEKNVHVSKSTYTQEWLHWKSSPFNFWKLFWLHEAQEIRPTVLCNFSMSHIRELIISEWTNLSVILVTAGKTEIGL